MTVIDIGPGAVNRGSYYAFGHTLIDLANPANGTGLIDTIELWFYATADGVKVATFADNGAPIFACWYEGVTIGPVTAGSKQTFTGLSVYIDSGGYLGVYYTTGNIEEDASGGSAVYHLAGEHCHYESNPQTYTLYSGWAISIYGTGLVMTAPTVTTQAATNVLTTSCTGNGNITATGGENCTRRGFCYKVGTSGTPTIADSVAYDDGSFGTGAYTKAITGLTPSTGYRVRAYAVNRYSIAYGSTVQVTTASDAIPKTSSETGAGVDAKAAYPSVTHSRSETGAGADTKGGRGFVRPETGAGTEFKTLLAVLLRTETGAGTDLSALLAALLRAETGAGVDHILARAIILTELATGVEGIGGRDFQIGDIGIGDDHNALDKSLSRADSGSGIDASYLFLIDSVLTALDSGAGVETSLWSNLRLSSDTGSAVDAVVARALTAQEYPAGAIDLAQTITAALQGQETGTGAELSVKGYVQKASDLGYSSEASSLVALFSGSDSGAGAEAITLLAAMISQDTGAGVDDVIMFLMQAVDSGHGLEVITLIGAVGRSMKLIIYLRQYMDLRVYTSEVRQ